MFRCLQKELKVSFKLKIQKRRYLGLHSPPFLKKFKKDRQVLKLMVSREQIRSEEITGPTLVEFDENGEIVKKQDGSGVALETDFL